MANKEELITQEELNIIIMSVVHDAKNALFQSQGTLSQLQERLETEIPEVNSVQQEILGINQSLMRLLTLYKMKTETFSLYRDQHNVYDFLEELMITNGSLLSKEKIKIEIDCDEFLEWYFDRDLISNILNSIINNTLRYTDTIIILKAFIESKQLIIAVEDDGQGFPEKMLFNENCLKTHINFNLQNSGLGLFFAEKIAHMHSKGEHNGHTSISNLATGGGCFKVYLP